MSHKTKTQGIKRKLSKKALDVLRRSEELKLQGDHKQAVGILEQLLVDDPECLEAVEEIADNLLSMDEFDKAKKASEYALTLDTESYIANHILGFLNLYESKWTEAIAFLKRANANKPNNAEILRCLGWGLFHADKRHEGLATLERALNLQDDNPMILCDLGVCLLQENQFKEAKELFEKAYKMDPDNERTADCINLINRFEKDFL